VTRRSGLAIALLAAAGAGAQAQDPPTLAVSALSRGKGVPAPTKAALAEIRVVLGQAQADGRVVAMASKRIGLEGETRTCVEFRDADAAAAMTARVRALAHGVDLLNVVEEPCRSEEKQP
jgi:hypothetical protein